MPRGQIDAASTENGMDLDVSLGEDWTQGENSIVQADSCLFSQSGGGAGASNPWRSSMGESSGTARAPHTPVSSAAKPRATAGGKQGGSAARRAGASASAGITPGQRSSSYGGPPAQATKPGSGPATGTEAAVGPTSEPSVRMREREELNGGILMFRCPLNVATVVVHGTEFPVHAELLCKHSDYFARALLGNFCEAKAQRVELDSDDVSVESFGLWVDLLYRSHFHRPGQFVLRKEETGGTLSTKQILLLWQLSDRFLHKPLTALAEESLHHRLSLYSSEQWCKLYRTRPASDIRARVDRLQDAYRLCAERTLPFGAAVVAACANCPPQVYADCVDLLDPDFMALVSARMILAHADTTLVGREQRLSGPLVDLKRA